MKRAALAPWPQRDGLHILVIVRPPTLAIEPLTARQCTFGPNPFRKAVMFPSTHKRSAPVSAI